MKKCAKFSFNIILLCSESREINYPEIKLLQQFPKLLSSIIVFMDQ